MLDGIYIRGPGYDIAWQDILVHEAAHARHYSLDRQISALWASMFSLERGSDWADASIRRSAGLVSAYAAFDYTRDKHEPTTVVMQTPRRYDFGRLTVEVSEEVKRPRMVAGKVLREVRNLPGRLRQNVTYVGVCPGMNRYGAFYHPPKEKPSSEYGRVTEDVAETTMTLYSVSLLPDLLFDMDIIGMIHDDNNPRLRGKLEFLVQHGFLDKRAASRLLDKTLLSSSYAPRSRSFSLVPHPRTARSIWL
ncbi:hypothetical protein HYV82_04705 [Candidatus Woesearchaeota archaeon]|nr:hypothetical protein [Candidatus Woesearchaeota archaeon]